jgi:CMP/dCMP kinase
LPALSDKADWKHRLGLAAAAERRDRQGTAGGFDEPRAATEVNAADCFERHAMGCVVIAKKGPIPASTAASRRSKSAGGAGSLGGSGRLTMIIAIDGPAASGKGTIARRIAAHYGLPHLDTGLLYRATAAALIGEDRNLYDEAAAVAAARGLGLTDFDDATLRTRQMGEAASVVAAMPGVRAALIEAQRAFAGRPGGSVLDGRDIGTVVCPEADVKIFVTASAATRAQRRALELIQNGEKADFGAILADIIRRDARDSGRAAAPLRPAEDAVQLDTTHLGIDATFAEALRIVEAARIRA